MIHDILKNGTKYSSIHPLFKKAFDFLTSTDLMALPLGKIELEGKNLVINVVDLTGKTVDEAKMESHKNYIDIQIPLGASETMGWASIINMNNVSMPYDSEKDLIFYADKASSFLTVQPFEFAIFFPDDVHQPGIAVGTHRKIIVKISV